MSKLLCMGECLVDFLPDDNGGFLPKAGGAPANVCASVSKLGLGAIFLGALSDDMFGRFLREQIELAGVDTSCVVTNCCPTALAFVQHIGGDRQFSFYRNGTADLMFDSSDVKEELFTSGDIFHFCSVSLVESKTKYAHQKAIESALQNGVMLSFDVNLRPMLWNDLDQMKSTVHEFLAYADIVKITDEELEFVADEQDVKSAVRNIFGYAKRAQLVFVTKGDKGVEVFDRNMDGFAVPALRTQIVDTTGAGDCFSGALIYNLLQYKPRLVLSEIKQAVEFAVTACSIVVERKGALHSMPTLDEVQSRLRDKQNN